MAYRTMKRSEVTNYWLYHSQSIWNQQNIALIPENKIALAVDAFIHIIISPCLQEFYKKRCIPSIISQIIKSHYDPSNCMYFNSQLTHLLSKQNSSERYLLENNLSVHGQIVIPLNYIQKELNELYYKHGTKDFKWLKNTKHTYLLL